MRHEASLSARLGHMTEAPIPIPIDRELALDLAAHLELLVQLLVRGGIPNPEHAAQLLRRLNDAIRHSRQQAPGIGDRARPTTPKPPAEAGPRG